MAIGAVTKLEEAAAGKATLRADLLEFAGDGAYVTGGTAEFQASVRAALERGNVEVFAAIPQDCGAYGVVYDKANDKLKVIVLATGVEAANALDISGTTFRVLVLSH